MKLRKLRYWIIAAFAVLLVGGIAAFVPLNGNAKQVKVIKTDAMRVHAYALKQRAVGYSSLKLTDEVKLENKQHEMAWYRDKYADVKINGQKTRLYHVSNRASNHSFWIKTSDLKTITSASFHPKGQALTPYHGKIGVVGDSIPAGWDGYHFNHGNSYFDWFGKYINMDAKNQYSFAVPDAKIVGHRYATYALSGNRVGQDLKSQIEQHKGQFQQLNYLYVAIGVNDYTNKSGSGSLKHIAKTLSQRLDWLQKLNPKMMIIGILPMNRYTNKGNDCSNFKNDRDFTLNEERDALRKVYDDHHMAVIDFNELAPELITPKNRLATLNDGILHPTIRTDQELGRVLAQTFEDKTGQKES